ncbi:tetratricopeptide repeat protein 12 [Sceloporus undulatus]|uniref:tetratricopeptide repeat protein 12 n=1 Tax=Sceloporus undulatus TaxID=8520 RepID=UPI001C4B4FD4|nr:tetratricopeptide repeat protein 12 [Sceloporus undulatus]
MSKQQEERDLQKFLQDVDEVTNLIQGLNSTDPSVQEKAITDTEKRIKSTQIKDEKKKPQVDRTVISAPTPDFPNHEESMDPDSFMAALEKDAEERARKRKENEALANALKVKGNDAFSKGDYEVAIERYTEGLKMQKDMSMLYTNRAQAYIKLQKYDKAISDCDWALRCDEKCIKALFHMGKAYLAQKQYSKSRECYLKILEIDPQKEKLCKGCMNEIDLEEKRQHEEQRAKEEFESGKSMAVSVSQLLEKLSMPDKDALYYAGGIRLLTKAMQDCTEQTLFRMNNGFSIINDNEVIRRVFHAKNKSPADVELSLSILLLWQAVCKGNEENQRFLLTHPDVNLQLPTLLLSEVPEIQEQCLALLSLYAETENGRSLLVRHLDTTKWLQLFMSFIKVSDSRARYAMNLLTTLIVEEKFKMQCRIKLSTEALPLFTQLLSSVKKVNELALAQCIAVMGDLCSDVVIQLQMAESYECWQACVNFVDECWVESKGTRYPESLYAVLGLMMNLSVQHSLAIQELAEEITRICMSLHNSKDERIVTRAVGLLSHIVPASRLALEEAMKQDVVKKMIRLLKAGGETISGYALKTLAACVRSSRQAQEQVVKLDKKCTTLLKLLRSQNEVVAGNAAFCLGKCLEVPGTATNMLDTNVVKILLKVTGGDAQKTSVQENAAIALGKLCTADARHTSRLRELNGMAILNTAMKYVQQ